MGVTLTGWDRPIQRETRAVVSEPGTFPTLYLRLLLSQRSGAPGDRVSVRVDGTDAPAFGRGKVLKFEKELAGDWTVVGFVIGGRTANDAGSRWIPIGSPPFAVTIEGYEATRPLYFEVPPVDPGDYRLSGSMSYTETRRSVNFDSELRRCTHR